MKKLMTAIMVFSLVLAGVSLAVAADLPQTPKIVELGGFQKLTDQEAQEIRGMGFGPGSGVCLNTCVANPIFNNNNNNFGTGVKLDPKLIYNNYNYGGNCLK